MNVDPKDEKNSDRDRFVLSKGHTVPALYAVLAKRIFFKRYSYDIQKDGYNSSGAS